MATASAVRDHCLAPSRSVDPTSANHRYTRMFPDLPHLVIEPDVLRAIAAACDISNAYRPETETVAAGWPVFGQYIAHDLTADRSPVTHHDDETLIRNVRSARLNLECLYGDGPSSSPYMYSLADGAKLLVDGDDLPRNQEGIALVGDPRQDVHLLISQMQVRFIKAHNLLVDRLREDGVAEGDLFEEARRALRWHYQWLALNDFLPATIGDDRVRALLAEGPRFFHPGDSVAIPFEFADAAYRFGHSQIRRSYRLQRGGESYELFPDLMGFRPVPAERVVDWSMYFDVPGFEPPMRARPIDGCLPESLLRLPVAITGPLDDQEWESLAARDLERGIATGLPSGEAVARRVGEKPLSRDEVGLARHGWMGETPLWFYILKEAQAREEGERLGPVGSLIVGEVLLGVIDGDPESFRAVDPAWRPTLPARDGARFTIGDLLIPA